MAYDLLLERFLRYAKINTRSDENATRTPTTQSQVDFALNILKPELEELGLSNIHYLESNGYLVATLPANDDRLTRKIGFISHMDTADFNAEGVSPQVIESYDGGIIPLGTSGYNLDPADFPNLQNYIGQTLITTDGTTLLGADDKSGIAEIMTALAHLKANPEIKHCEIRVGFGPDEEIGIGADKFDVDDFDVDFAYTVDGGPLGELQYETFSAAGAELTFHGRNVHPGTAKDQMVNALQLAIDFHNQLPADSNHNANRSLLYQLPSMYVGHNNAVLQKPVQPFVPDESICAALPYCRPLPDMHFPVYLIQLFRVSCLYILKLSSKKLLTK